MALSITKAYLAGTILTEAHLDHFRNGLLDLFNTTKLSSTEFKTNLTLDSDKFADDILLALDTENIVFGTDDDGEIGLNATKDFVFNTTTATCYIDFYVGNQKMLCFDGTNMLLYGDLYFGLGQSTYSLLYLLSRYRKPVLKWDSTSSVSIENNTGTLNETILALPSRVLAVNEAVTGSAKFRYATINNTANGYDSAHTGAARGGIRSGLTVASNTWYCVYGVRVRYGTDAGNNFILIFDTTTPTQANEATLDTRYGTGEWVYLGLVRRGYGVSGSSTSIIPFEYSNKGWCYFTGNDSGAAFGGVLYFSSSTNADNTPMYEIADGTGSAQVPCDVISKAQFAMHRDSTTMFRARDTSNNIYWGTGGVTAAVDYVSGYISEFAVEPGIDFTLERIRTGSFAKRFFMTGFCDRYVNNGRHGHGV